MSENALDVYHILRLVRQYLRLFDDGSSLLSEVYPATMELRRKLELLPLTSFYTAARRTHVLNVFDARLKGIGGQVPLVTRVHHVAYLLDIRSVGQGMQEFSKEIADQVGVFVRSNSFARSRKLESDGGVDGAIDRLCQDFAEQRISWRSQSYDPLLRHALMRYSRNPVFYWSEVSEKTLLRQFALQILCVSPSSGSVERSFSVEGRIRTPLRNRLHHEKVSMLEFCAFNESLLQSRGRASKIVNSKAYMDLRFGKVVYAVATVRSDATATGEAYCRFFDDEVISDFHLGPVDCEEDDMDIDLEDETMQPMSSQHIQLLKQQKRY